MPDQSAELSFSRSFFGYDPLEVKAFIDELNAELDQLRTRCGLVSAGSDAVSAPDLGVAIDSAVSDIAEVLEAARVASGKMRERAEHEAEDRLAEAAQSARRMLAAAEAEAFSLRKAAWDTSTEVLESVKAESTRQRAVAERDALGIIGDAERKAHRKLAAARRDSATAIQAAAAEGERVLGLARAKAQEVVRASELRVGAAEDQLGALEEEYQQLLQETEGLRSMLEGPEPEGAKAPSTVRVVRSGTVGADEGGSIGDQVMPDEDVRSPEADGAPAGVRTVGWGDGTDNVRLVETPAASARLEVDALELAEEVARLRVGDNGARTGSVDGSGNGADPDDVRLVQASNGPPPVTNAGPDTRPDPAPIWDGVTETRLTDELAALFMELRMKEDKTAKSLVALSDSQAVLAPVERYERMLLPVINRALRAVKRRLIEIQTTQIEAVGDEHETWNPDRSQLASQLVHVLSVMEREAYERGHTAASVMTGSRLAPPRGEPTVRAMEPFVSDLHEAVAAAVRDAREAGWDRKEMSGAISRVYRAWRTDEAERRIRFIVGQVYHEGLLKGLGEAGVDGYRIEVNDGCADCASLGGEVLPENEVPALPVHAECRCTIVPA